MAGSRSNYDLDTRTAFRQHPTEPMTTFVDPIELARELVCMETVNAPGNEARAAQTPTRLRGRAAELYERLCVEWDA
jgi:hypothetical protein